MDCLQCGAPIPPNGRSHTRTFCSRRCRDLKVKRVPCGACGELVWLGSGSAEKPTCRPCRSAKFQHGTVGGYKRIGCRCDLCREAQALAQREFKAKRKADGRPYRRPKGSGYRRYSLSEEQRRAIFERDSWVCQICLEPLDREAHWNAPSAPTLDHIEPQSLALIPDHSASNLRAAHRRCNASRGNRLDEQVASC